ncbi:MAG: glycoside hydrolase family 2 [Clostridia bacterium]|nr:glycoside hydrolase family 2 [Clostridia bacterium]
MKKQETKLIQLYTPEGEALMADRDAIAWSEYPRPQMERESYLCLNGIWDFAVSEHGETVDFGERIRVPFVPESVLSGIGRRMPKGGMLCYRRTFSLPDGFMKGRVILHVGAADQIARVVVNGTRMGVHRGGYEPFSFDVTDVLADENTLEIFVTDELESRVLPYGKQCERRGGMWYTPISGIWQTVWLESVPEEYIRSLTFKTDANGAELTVETSGKCKDGEVVLVCDGEDLFLPVKNGRARIDVKDPILWSPENPHLYRVAVRIGEDVVRSYFALRTLEVREVGGTKRLCLNGEPYFFHGLLDQGYFSDGIFLPASPSGYENDILTAKKLGFNMLRKHIKVEPALFYYACDRLGMVVFQDMVNNGDYSFFRDTALPTVGIKRLSDKRMHRDADTRRAFLEGMEQTVRLLSHHPCVCYWTIFNEGWGQFDHAVAYKRLRELDDTRFIDSTSGWFSPLRKKDTCTDVESLHVYFKPVKVKVEDKPIVLSEFGGYSYRVAEHISNLTRNYGYKSFCDKDSLEDALEHLYLHEVLPAIEMGLCAAVYTQLSDVEDETNGLLTYDRRVEKVSAERMQSISQALFATFFKKN